MVELPLPPVGTTICLQLNIIGEPEALEGGIDIRYTIAHGDDPVTVAAAIVALINTGPDADLAKTLSIYAVQTPGINNIAIINQPPNLVVLSDQTGPVTGGAVASAFTIYPGGSAELDAGPVFGLIKNPPGIVPVAGSNIGQIFFAAPTVTNGPAAQFLTIGCNVINPQTGSASFMIYTKNTGAVPPQVLFQVDETGCWALGKQIA